MARATPSHLPQEVVRADFLCQHASCFTIDEELFSSRLGPLLLLSQAEGEKAASLCLLGKFPVLKGLSILSASVAPNKGRKGIFLDILMPEECNLNLVGRARETTGPAGCRLS